MRLTENTQKTDRNLTPRQQRVIRWLRDNGHKPFANSLEQSWSAGIWLASLAHEGSIPTGISKELLKANNDADPTGEQRIPHYAALPLA